MYWPAEEDGDAAAATLDAETGVAAGAGPPAPGIRKVQSRQMIKHDEATK